MAIFALYTPAIESNYMSKEASSQSLLLPYGVALVVVGGRSG